MDVKIEQTNKRLLCLPEVDLQLLCLSEVDLLLIVIFPRFLCFYHELVGYIVNVFFFVWFNCV